MSILYSISGAEQREKFKVHDLGTNQSGSFQAIAYFQEDMRRPSGHGFQPLGWKSEAEVKL